MTQRIAESEQWEPCQPGDVGQVVHQLRVKRRKSDVAKAATACVVVLCLSLVPLYLFGPLGDQGNTYGGIACNDVSQHATGYLQGNLDNTLMSRIDQHLVRCNRCKEKLDAMKKSESAEAKQRNAPIQIAEMTGHRLVDGIR